MRDFMIFKSKIKGQISCYCDGDVIACRNLLKNHRIPHSVNGNKISIDSEVKVVPFFDNHKFADNIRKLAKKYGDVDFDASDIIEEKDNEKATRLLHQRR